MKILIDAIMREYVSRLIGNFWFTLDGFRELTEANESTQEQVLIASLKCSVMCGAASHVYLPTARRDEFRATERLTKNWGWIFPGDILDIADPAETFLITIKGKRSQHFPIGWEIIDLTDPPPSWPH